LDKRARVFLRIVLAVLPAWIGTVNMREALLLGGLVTVFLWTSAGLFYLTRDLFPSRWIKTAFILWVATLAQIEFLLRGMPPYWALSVILLMPEEMWRGALPRDWSKRVFLHGTVFWLLVAYLGVSQEFFGEWLLVYSFQSPVGLLVLLGVAALAWQKRTDRQEEKLE